MSTRYYDECAHLAERVIAHLDQENSTGAADEVLRVSIAFLTMSFSAQLKYNLAVSGPEFFESQERKH